MMAEAGTAGAAMAFAVPGDIDTVTGGYLYDRRLGDALARPGTTSGICGLATAFRTPRARIWRTRLPSFEALPPDCPALVDGLAYGALDPEGLSRLRAPVVALVHHPLALEPGLGPDQARRMAAREAENLALARHIVVTSPHIAGLLQDHYGVAAWRISVAQPGFTPPAPAPPRTAPRRR